MKLNKNNQSHTIFKYELINVQSIKDTHAHIHAVMLTYYGILILIEYLLMCTKFERNKKNQQQQPNNGKKVTLSCK